MLAIGAIAIVALGGDDGLGNREQVLGLEESRDVGEARMRGGISVRGSQAAADREIEADQLPALDDRDEAQIAACRYRRRWTAAAQSPALNLRGRKFVPYTGSCSGVPSSFSPFRQIS
jgi:hypothetical protein